MTLILNGTTGVSGVDGSAATPAFQGNDANTGISFGTDIVTINTGGQARVTTDASGNVGIGTVLPASKLEVTGDVQQTWAASMDRFVGSKFSTTYELGVHFLESSRETRLVSKAADSTGLISFYTGVTPTEKMRISASGNVGIGATSAGQRLTVATSTDFQMRIGAANATGVYDIGRNATSGLLTFYGNQTAFTGYVFSGVDGERARINSDGNLLVGTTAQLGAVVARAAFSSASNVLALQAGNGSVGAYMTNASSTGNWQPFSFNNNGTSFSQIGSITCTASATAYNTSSDYRLKENVAPMIGALQTVAALKPVTYTWKTDGSDGQGFIAHELQAVVPDCVTGAKDAVDAEGKPQYQGVDTSFLVATLVAAIQELKAEVDALKGAQNV
jgi:hypothetical protein